MHFSYLLDSGLTSWMQNKLNLINQIEISKEKHSICCPFQVLSMCVLNQGQCVAGSTVATLLQQSTTVNASGMTCVQYLRVLLLNSLGICHGIFNPAICPVLSRLNSFNLTLLPITADRYQCQYSDSI